MATDKDANLKRLADLLITALRAERPSQPLTVVRSETNVAIGLERSGETVIGAWGGYHTSLQVLPGHRFSGRQTDAQVFPRHWPRRKDGTFALEKVATFMVQGALALLEADHRFRARMAVEKSEMREVLDAVIEGCGGGVPADIDDQGLSFSLRAADGSWDVSARLYPLPKLVEASVRFRQTPFDKGARETAGYAIAALVRSLTSSKPG